jgi:hypothetical protein
MKILRFLKTLLAALFDGKPERPTYYEPVV